LSAGRHEVVVDFVYDGGFGAGGDVVVTVDGSAVAHVRKDKTVPLIFSISGETFDVGLDSGAPVGFYPHINRFAGTVIGVTLERLSEPSPEVKAMVEDGMFRASLAVQ
jgi:arylsulfatase